MKEIEITNLNTSVTWLCEFNCWLPKTDGQEREEHYQIKPTTNPYGELLFDKLSGKIDFSKLINYLFV